ncbi:MAG TPA: hypothetical protein DGG95_18105 [Cytophagales bacterium]|jgi:hypothetical protein|nr:hypothetical protein [Cytophagales bacterium]
MVVKRVSATIITVDDVVFEYNERTLTYETFSDNYDQNHVLSLNHFLVTETPEIEKEYKDYFRFLDKLADLLKERGICSEL